MSTLDLTDEVWRASVGITMGAKWQRLQALAWVAGCLLVCSGCANLKPGASLEQPETGGGLQVDDHTRGGIEILGDILYCAFGWL